MAVKVEGTAEAEPRNRPCVVAEAGERGNPDTSKTPLRQQRRRGEHRITGLVFEGEEMPRRITATGRVAQALETLVHRGQRGVTAAEISSWALRLSHYILMLRTEHDLDIETIREDHQGDFPGWHGRYVLRSRVTLIDRDGNPVVSNVSDGVPQ